MLCQCLLYGKLNQLYMYIYQLFVRFLLQIGHYRVPRRVLRAIATHFSILAWKSPWTEELGGLHSVGRAESDMTKCVCTHTHSSVYTSIPVSQFTLLNPCPWQPCLFSTSVTLFLFCKFICTQFLRCHI